MMYTPTETGDNVLQCKYLQYIYELEQDVMTFNLPQTVGFFFGSDSVGDEYQKEQTLEFLKKARKALAEGFEVEYNSWW